MGMGMAEIPQIPWEVHGNGERCCRNTSGIEYVHVGML